MWPSREPKQRKITPPSPTYMSKDQMANYLSDLRTKRTPRPGGARPLPSNPTQLSRSLAGRFSPDITSLHSQISKPSIYSHGRSLSSNPSITAFSTSSRYSVISGQGRDYYPREPSATGPLKPSQVVPTTTYMERGQRWMEKEEAFSLRDAMEQMEIRDSANTPDEESRIYKAALDEASELVWQHQNGIGQDARPDGPYRYRPHLRKNSYAHARTASTGTYGNDIAATGMRRDTSSRSVSNSSNDSEASGRNIRISSNLSHITCDSGPSNYGNRRKTYGGIGINAVSGNRRRSSMNRNISGEVNNPFVADQIWEEPDVDAHHASPASGSLSRPTLGSRTQNPVGYHKRAVVIEQAPQLKQPDKVEIHRNPPSQSHNGSYTTNAKTVPRADHQVERKNGIEVRGQDIRDATSMRLKDRSAKLPEPTAVSDSPGRPIVSFDTAWKPPGETTDGALGRNQLPEMKLYGQQLQSHSKSNGGQLPSTLARGQGPTRTQLPAHAAVPKIILESDDNSRSKNSIPAINIPTIVVPGEVSSKDPPSSIGLPAISISNNDESDKNDPKSAAASDSPIKVGANDKSNPSTSGSASGAVNSSSSRPPRQFLDSKQRSHWSPAPDATFRSKTLCHDCGFPIEGRFVALAGISERFHPQCFSCFTCHMSLEAMEISPEPDATRTARLDRIRRREAGELLEDVAGATAAEDGDERLRFYCHLDWHEQFAPRCKHCGTPILGEHVVALGEHWHNGHFFCAECGDPFEHGATHIEKDGYAWCVGCQTRRTERRAPRCRRCNKGVVGQYVQALGGEWHDECFRCAACKGGFDDGQVFPRDDGSILCTSCRMIELKR